MDRLRGVIIGLANLIIAATIVLGTVSGFMVGGMGYEFSVVRGVLGAAVGFLASAAAMTLLALLVDIRAILLRIEAREPRGRN